MKIFSAQLKGTTTVATGANVSLTGSFSGSIAGIDINGVNSFTASLGNTNTFTASLSNTNEFTASLVGTNTFTSSTSERLDSIETISASNISRISSLETTSASVDTLNTIQNSRLDSLEIKTGSLATTGSNTFYGTQVFSGSLYVKENLIVQGSSSLQNITASAVDIGTNKIILNVNNPSVRYAGISVYDSGSTAGTGSLFWDSVNNYWLYEHPADSGAPYNSAILISGPKNEGNLGEEVGLNTNYIMKAVGGDHISSSAIYDDGTTISLKSNTEVTGSFKLTSNVTFGLTGDRSIGWGGNTQASAVNPIIYSDNNYLALNSKAGSKLYLNYDNTNASSTVDFFNSKVVIKSDGSVGMGTNNPTQPLSVKGGIHSDVSYTNGYYGAWLYGDTSGSSQSFLGLGVWYSQAGYVKWYDNTRLAIYTYSTDKYVTLQEVGGNVGIGTSNPSSAKLQINGARESKLLDVDSDGFDGRYILLPGRFVVGTMGSGYPQIGYNYTMTGAAYTKIGNDTAWGINFGTNNLMRFNYAGTGTGAFSFNTGMVMDSSGRIGIGNTNPSYNLTVNASASDAISWRNGSEVGRLGIDGNTTNGWLALFSSGTPKVQITAGSGDTYFTGTGGFGIGTNAPSGKFHVDHADTYHMGILHTYISTYVTSTKFGRTSTDSNIELRYDIAGSEIAYLRRNYPTAQLRFDRGSTTDMIISGDGKVGINDSNPSTRLSINGANYVEMATFTTVDNSSVITNNSGYIPSFTARYNSNSNVFSPTTNGIQILKAGILHVTVAQDIRTAGTTGYSYLHIRKNGTTISENLITNTNTEWDMINANIAVDVAANDIINFYISGADILALDTGSWSQYVFLWTSR